MAKRAYGVSLELYITDIRPAVKNSQRVNVFLNQKYDFSLTISQLAELKLKVGEQVTEERRLELHSLSDFGKLLQATMEYLMRRPYSIKEIRDYLVNKKRRRDQENRRCKLEWGREEKRKIYEDQERCPRERQKNYRKDSESYGRSRGKTLLSEIREEQIDEVIKVLTERGYLDDKKFTLYYLENRFKKKGISQKRLRLELLKKGISEEMVDQVLIENPNLRREEEEIKKIVDRKVRQGYEPDKLISYLVRQGFDFELAKTAVHEKD